MGLYWREQDPGAFIVSSPEIFSLDAYADAFSSIDPDSPRLVRTLEECYDGFKFWDDQKHFLKLTIHVRRDGVSGTEVNT